MKPTSWTGRIKIKPSTDVTLSPVKDLQIFDFGEHNEITEEVLLDTWGNLHFGELRFNTKSKISGLDEIRYAFHNGFNLKDTQNANILIDFPKVLMTDEKCYFIAQAEIMVFNEHIPFDDEPQKLCIQVICEFLTDEGLVDALTTICESNQIPCWKAKHINLPSIAGSTHPESTQKGSMKFQYTRTTIYFDPNGCNYYKDVPRPFEANKEIRTGIEVTYDSNRFTIYFINPRNNGQIEMSNENKINEYHELVSDDNHISKNRLYLEQVLVNKHNLILLGKIRLEGYTDEYDFFDFFMKLPVNKKLFDSMIESNLIDLDKSWNLYELFSEKEKQTSNTSATNSDVNPSVYQYQCFNDGHYIPIWFSKCPDCGIDNTKQLIDGGYYERLTAHLKKIDPSYWRD